MKLMLVGVAMNNSRVWVHFNEGKALAVDQENPNSFIRNQYDETKLYWSQEAFDKLESRYKELVIESNRMREALESICGNKCDAYYNPCEAKQALKGRE